MKRVPYSPEELELIKNLREKAYSWKDIGEITGRSPHNLKQRMWDLEHRKTNQKKWRSAEKKWLSENYLNHSISYLTEALGRTRCAVEWQIKVLITEGKIKPEGREWTNDDERFLEETYTKEPKDYISAVLNRTEKEIKMKAKMLGLR